MRKDLRYYEKDMSFKLQGKARKRVEDTMEAFKSHSMVSGDYSIYCALLLIHELVNYIKEREVN